MKLRTLVLTSVLAASFGAAQAAGTLYVDQVDSDVAGSTDTFAGSISNGVGTLDGNWAFTLDTPTDGSKWSVISFLVDFASPYATSVSASLSGVTGSVSTTGRYTEVTFAGTFNPGAQTLTLGGFGAGNGSVSLEATAVAVPEPGSMAMVLAGLGIVGFMSRRRKSRE